MFLEFKYKGTLCIVVKNFSQLIQHTDGNFETLSTLYWDYRCEGTRSKSSSSFEKYTTKLYLYVIQKEEQTGSIKKAESNS